jgi:hypothetical protein
LYRNTYEVVLPGHSKLQSQHSCTVVKLWLDGIKYSISGKGKFNTGTGKALHSEKFTNMYEMPALFPLPPNIITPLLRVTMDEE